MRSSRIRCAAALAISAVLIASCSTSSSAASSSIAPATSASGVTVATAAAASPEAVPVLPVTVTDMDGRPVTITDVSRIIPVNGDLAEVVYALGLGADVVATDISATYPVEATTTPRIGYQRALVAETILTNSPTIILADDMAGPPDVLSQLRATGVTVLTIERLRTVDAPAAKIMAVATALGVPNRGRALVATMQTKIDAALAAAKTAVATSGRPKVLALYLRGSGVQLTFGKGSGVDVFIDAAGGTDMGTAAGIVDTQQLSEEAVIAGAPDIILVTTTGLESVGGIDGLLQIPAIANTPAGKNRRILAYEDQYLYGFGPRTGDLLTELVAAFHAPAQAR